VSASRASPLQSRGVGGPLLVAGTPGVTVTESGSRQRPALSDGDEPQHPEWGATTGDLYINPNVYFRNVPAAVWDYELGGYPVLKKWLGYRQASRGEQKALTLEERRHFRSMIQRLAAVLTLEQQANKLYEAAAAAAFTAEVLGVRR
jgi:hypothetical protein